MQQPAQPYHRSVLFRLFLAMLSMVAVIQGIAVTLLFFVPERLAPHPWQPKASPTLSGLYVPNDALTRGRLLATRWVEAGNEERARYQGVGPETVALGPDGYLYTGLCDADLGGTLENPPACRLDGESQGWVVRIHPKAPSMVEPYVQTGGRPLGLTFDRSGRLYIADGLQGLLRVASHPSRPEQRDPRQDSSAQVHSVERVATCNYDDDTPDHLPLYTDSVAIGPDGEVWFTCPSQRWPLAEIRSEVMENQPTGRVLRYTPCAANDPLRCSKKVVADRLFFANGIAVSDGGRSLLVNEWSAFRITRLRLDQNKRVNAREPFFENLPGYPDNLTIADDGTVWTGLSLRRQELVDRFRPYPFLISALARLPASISQPGRYAWVVGIDPQGKLKFSLHDPSGFFDQATGVYPVGDALYLGSYGDGSLLCIRRPGSETARDPCDPWARDTTLALASPTGEGPAEPLSPPSTLRSQTVEEKP